MALLHIRGTVIDPNTAEYSVENHPTRDERGIGVLVNDTQLEFTCRDE